MAGRLSYERYYWFDGRIRQSQYPNARKLADRYEISQKQAQREIDFMRDRLGAPLRYDSHYRGYEYVESSYELPPVWFDEEELLALCLALRLSATVPDRKLKTALAQLLEKFFRFRSAISPPLLQDVADKVSVKNIEYYRVDELIFRQVAAALFQKRAIEITYRTPYTGEETQRLALPLHLLCYMGSWHLIAFCSLKGDLRDFALSRIKNIRFSSEQVHLPSHLLPIRAYLDTNFGLMSSGKQTEVCLRFLPDVAAWISEQVWHFEQEAISNDDGSVCLKFHVCDFREVKREILKYGASVEVLSPPELREEVRKEVERMRKIYV